MKKTQILVVDDDPAMSRLVRTNLKARGYGVAAAMNGEEALETIEREFFNLIILDIMMPKLDGLEVCRRVREWSEVPIIILSARGDEKDKVTCLDLGANDYLTKPFGIAELVARIKAALRYSDVFRFKQDKPSLTCGEIEIDFLKRRVTVGGKEVSLTPTEYFLLQALAADVGKVLTHKMLLQKAWGAEYSDEKQYLTVYISRLRRKLEKDPDNPRYIITVPRVGYYLFSET